MGLDLSVVKNLKFIGSDDEFSEKELNDLWDSKVYLYKNDMLFGQSDGLKGGFYDGEYDISLPTLNWSYSGYYKWRNVLTNLIGYDDVGHIGEKYKWVKRDDTISYVLGEKIEREREPFVEMCYFTDCEGFIGPKTSSKLYKDFVDNKDKYKKYLESLDMDVWNKDFYINHYKNITEYFRIASEENGAVVFH